MDTCFSSCISLQQQNGCSLLHQLPMVLLGAASDPRLGLGAAVWRVNVAALLCRSVWFPVALIFILIPETQYKLELWINSPLQGPAAGSLNTGIHFYNCCGMSFPALSIASDGCLSLLWILASSFFLLTCNFCHQWEFVVGNSQQQQFSSKDWWINSLA